MQLTRDSDKFLCEIYAEFLSRRKSDIPKSSAAEFSSPENLVNEFMQGTSPDYIRDCIQNCEKSSLFVVLLSVLFVWKTRQLFTWKIVLKTV